MVNGLGQLHRLWSHEDNARKTQVLGKEKIIKCDFQYRNENKTSQQEFQKKIPSVQYSSQLWDVTDYRGRPHGSGECGDGPPKTEERTY